MLLKVTFSFKKRGAPDHLRWKGAFREAERFGL
jgi:hypothetical protein